MVSIVINPLNIEQKGDLNIVQYSFMIICASWMFCRLTHLLHGSVTLAVYFSGISNMTRLSFLMGTSRLLWVQNLILQGLRKPLQRHFSIDEVKFVCVGVLNMFSIIMFKVQNANCVVILAFLSKWIKMSCGNYVDGL